MSAISLTVSRLSTVLICVNRENLSLTLQVVTLERKDTNERTSRSSKRPPRRLKLKTEDVDVIVAGYTLEGQFLT